MALQYTVERSRNRHSRAVLRDDTIVIRLARGLPSFEEQRHIDNLLRRMTKAHAKQAVKTVIDPFRPLLQGEPSINVDLITGSLVSFRVEEGRRTRATPAHSGWLITRSPIMNDVSFERFLWKPLSISALPEITTLVHEINARTLRVPVRSVSLKFMKSRWGSCSHRGNMALATPLLFTSSEILE